MDIGERRSLQYLLNKLVAENRQWNIRDVLIGNELCIRYSHGNISAVRVDITEKSTEEALLVFAQILCGERPEGITVEDAEARNGKINISTDQ